MKFRDYYNAMIRFSGRNLFNLRDFSSQEAMLGELIQMQEKLRITLPESFVNAYCKYDLYRTNDEFYSPAKVLFCSISNDFCFPINEFLSPCDIEREIDIFHLLNEKYGIKMLKIANSPYAGGYFLGLGNNYSGNIFFIRFELMPSMETIEINPFSIPWKQKEYIINMADSLFGLIDTLGYVYSGFIE